MFFKFFNFVCNYYYKKDSIKIKKTNYKERIIRINKYLTRLVFLKIIVAELRITSFYKKCQQVYI